MSKLSPRPRFGVQYDDTDREDASMALQKSWRGYSVRRRLQAAKSIQSVMRGRLVRKNMSTHRTSSNKRMSEIQRVRNERASRGVRLQRLELEMRMLEATDADSYYKFMVKRQNRAAIKVQKMWRLKVQKKRLLKGRKIDVEVTPELEEAVIKIQRYMRHSRKKWHPPAYPPPQPLRRDLELKIRQHLREPLKDSSMANNPEWVTKEASERFWRYRAERSKQQGDAWNRKIIKREMDNMIARIECTQDLDSLPSIHELEQRGLLRVTRDSTRTTQLGLTDLRRSVSDNRLK